MTTDALGLTAFCGKPKMLLSHFTFLDNILLLFICNNKGMKHIYLVTGSQQKLSEWRRILPDTIAIDSVDIDLPEIQSMNPEEVVADKAKRAYEIAQKPVVVEDVSQSVDALGGLPGPFIKFFVKALGDDATYKLAGNNARAVVSCTAAYYDEKELVTVKGDVPGKIVAPRGANGFGFDVTFVPDGHEKTYAEMDSVEKDQVSHRGRAIKLLIEALQL